MKFLWPWKREVIRSIDDLIDPRAKQLAEDHWINTSQLPKLHEELKKNRNVVFTSQQLAEMPYAPEIVKIFYAAAMVNYEFTKRRRICIQIERTESDAELLGFASGTTRTTYAQVKRPFSVSEHEHLAGEFQCAADQLYSAYEEARRSSRSPH